MRILTLCLLLVSMIGCGSSGSDSAGQAPTQHARGVIISESEKGTNQWLLKADEASFYDDKQIVDLVKPILDFREEDNSVSTITANIGHYDMQNSLITMIGKVTASSPRENAKLYTEEAFYDTKTKEILINVPVKVVKGQMTLNGQGLKASGDLSTIEVLKQKIQLPQHMQDFKNALK